jgi:succinyl-CoA synthetase beta subunit
MLLVEADGKALFRQYGIAVPDGEVVRSAAWHGTGPRVVKAQVTVGGRGKAGGVALCRDAAETEAALTRILHSSIKGHAVQACLVEAPATGRECYLSILLDAGAGALRVTFIAEGGVEVESHTLTDAHTQLCAPDEASINAALAALTDDPAVREVGAKLAKLFLREELMLAEINPLFVSGTQAVAGTKSHAVAGAESHAVAGAESHAVAGAESHAVAGAESHAVAGDAKVVLDGNALHRQPGQEALLRANAALYPDALRKLDEGFDYVELDAQGSIGLITTGAGLSMMLVDELTARGAHPINFLDIRTGQLRGSPARLIRVLEWLSAHASLRVLFVNIFAGITDQREFAQLLAAALQAQPCGGVPVVARLVGNGSEEARVWLAAARPDIAIFEDLEPAIARVAEHAR